MSKEVDQIQTAKSEGYDVGYAVGYETGERQGYEAAKEEKAANVYFSESMPKFLSTLVNDALEESGATVNHVSADTMQVIMDKAVTMEETLQKVESTECELRLYNGGCPVCGEATALRHIDSAEWFYCEDHKTCWNPSDNCISHHPDETPEERKQEAIDNAKFFDEGGYAIVEPVYIKGDEAMIRPSANHERDKIQNELYMDAIKAITGYRGCTPDEAMDQLEPEKRDIPF